VYAAFFVISAVAALLIDMETRNRRLSDVTMQAA
jgi:hypothetical protein